MAGFGCTFIFFVTNFDTSIIYLLHGSSLCPSELCGNCQKDVLSCDDAVTDGLLPIRACCSRPQASRRILTCEDIDNGII